MSAGKTLIGGRNNKIEKCLSKGVKEQGKDLKDVVTWGDSSNFGLRSGRASLEAGTVSQLKMEKPDIRIAK